MLAQLPATPVRMLDQQLANFLQLAGADVASLNDVRWVHRGELWRKAGAESRKKRNYF